MSYSDKSDVQMLDESKDSVVSSECRNKPLFDQNEFSNIENDPRLSLQLLANCVYITTCTVLRERQLLPAKSFTDFNVYGNTKGYFMNENDRHGKVVAKKFASASETIANKTLNKFALIVEMDENTSPIEAFVWSFKYDTPGETAARLGFKGKTQTFTVKYTDMHETSRQFCKLFSDLRSILNDLDPLPDDAIPSFRLALRDEPVDFDDYFAVDEFVNMNNFVVGTVRYPREEAFLSYASNYRAPENASTMAMSNVSNTELRNLGSIATFDDQSQVFEVSRHEPKERETNETIRENSDDSFMDFDVPAAGNNAEVSQQHTAQETLSQSDVDLDDSGLSLRCEPNIVSQQEIRPESAETVVIGAESMYASLQVSPPVAREEIDLSDKPKKRTKRASKNLTKLTSSFDEARSLPQKQLRRSARHSESPIKSQNDLDMIPMDTGAQSSPKAVKVVKYGRVPSILGLVEPKTSPPPIKKYGRVPSVRDLRISQSSEVSEARGRRYGKSRSLMVDLD